MTCKNIALRTNAFDIPKGAALMDMAVYVKDYLTQTGHISGILASEDGSIILQVHTRDSFVQKNAFKCT